MRDARYWHVASTVIARAGGDPLKQLLKELEQ